ncbi:MAG: hypothetical protein K1X89_21080 [Myxococcaceae bacterium]|nr:hypothetical protein [Myxococcaceae bacterium]
MIKSVSEVRHLSRSLTSSNVEGFKPGTTRISRGVYVNQGTLPDGTLATIRWREGQAPTISTGGQTRELTGAEMQALGPVITGAAGEGSNRLGFELLARGNAEKVRELTEQAQQRRLGADDFCPAPPTLPRF